jgi:hypothetical protein
MYVRKEKQYFRWEKSLETSNVTEAKEKEKSNFPGFHHEGISN